MVYFILAEPRSGGQTLIDWFRICKQGFYTVHEPFNASYNDFTTDTTLQDFTWIKQDNNYIIKELWRINVDYQKVLDVSDKVICLYRENMYEQIRSNIIATKTGNYNKPYPKTDENLVSQQEIEHFHSELIKSREALFDFANKNNLDIISYEDLYHSNGIEKIKSWFNINCDIPFPHNSRYFGGQIKII